MCLLDSINIGRTPSHVISSSSNTIKQGNRSNSPSSRLPIPRHLKTMAATVDVMPLVGDHQYTDKNVTNRSSITGIGCVTMARFDRNTVNRMNNSSDGGDTNNITSSTNDKRNIDNTTRAHQYINFNTNDTLRSIVMKYAGCTGNGFKHRSSFRILEKRSVTSLAGHIWCLKERGINFSGVCKNIQDPTM